MFMSQDGPVPATPPPDAEAGYKATSQAPRQSEEWKPPTLLKPLSADLVFSINGGDPNFSKDPQILRSLLQGPLKRYP